ncbi:hypothetical protein ID866_11955 [Astraeus odoratus]|nr:hypothetical protein ID866_11955 [Astraeus odoratus]
MSTRKSSTIAGTPVEKSIDWMKVPDEELVTDIDDTDLVGNAKAWEKHRRLCAAHDKEIWRAEKASAAAEARKWQWVDSEAQASGSQASVSACIRCTRLKLTCIIPAGVKKRSACGSCAKAKEREHKKWVKKAANKDDEDEVVILSGQKTKRQGGGKSLEEVTDRWWGELIQAVSTRMDVANSHLERIASVAQSNGRKMQRHFLLMEGLVGQQQVLVSKLVKMAGAAGSGGAKGVAEGQEELKVPQEMQGEGSEGQEETQGVPGGALGDEPENALGNEPENGAGVEDGAEEEGQQSQAKGKGKERAL